MSSCSWIDEREASPRWSDMGRIEMDHENCGCSRRGMIRSLVSGSIMLPAIISQLLSDEARGATADDANPLAPKAPHFQARAKRVIFMCMSGGVSHVDTF